VDNLFQYLASLSAEPFDCIVHVGAGADASADYYAVLQPKHVVLIEADPESHAALAERFKDSSRATVIQALVGAAAGETTFHRYTLPSLNAPLGLGRLRELYPRIDEIETILLQSTLLHEILDEKSLGARNLLVLDVPGQEAAILRSMPSDFLGRFSQLIAMTTAEVWQEGAETAQTTLATLKEHDFELERESGDDPAWPHFLLRHDPAKAALKQELEHRARLLVSNATQIHHQDERIAELEKQVALMTSSCQDAETEKARVLRKLSVLETSTRSAAKKRAVAYNERRKAGYLQSKQIANLQKSSAALQSERDILLAERDALAVRVSALESENSELATRHSSLVTSSGDLAIRHTSLAATLEELQTQHSSLVAERDDLTGRLAGREAEHSDLVTRHSSLVTALEELQGRHTSLATSQEALLAERDALATRVSALESEHSELATRHTSLVTESETLHSSLVAERDDLATRYQQLTTERDALAERISSLESENSELATRHTSLATTLEELQAQHSSLVAERDDLVTRHTSLSTEREALLSSLESELGKARSELADRQAFIQSSYKKQRALDEQRHAEYTRTLFEVTQERDALLEMNKCLQSSLAEAQHQAALLDESMSKAEGQLDFIKEVFLRGSVR
jgi:FkbM family methyltransferase